MRIPVFYTGATKGEMALVTFAETKVTRPRCGNRIRDDILGNKFHAGTLGYFGEYIALSHVASQPQKARHQLPYGYGTFGYEPNVQTFFGFPRAITAGGIAVNVRLGWVVHSLDGDPTKRPQLSLQTGILSSTLEHAVPEQMFSTPSQQAQGVSAVRALQIASSQGQRIYHITPQNQAQALPNLHLDGLAMQEITTALATGKEVITHTDRISVPGWTGEGYILFDPVSGSGAYKITGGSNGSFIVGLILGFMFALSLSVGVISLLGLGLVPLLLAVVTLANVAYVLHEIYLTSHQSCLTWGFIMGMGLFFFFLVGKPVIISVLMFFLFQIINAGLGGSPIKWTIPPELSGCLARP